jgi:uncharacterized membrane protein YjgN (DUF898 family)
MTESSEVTTSRQHDRTGAAGQAFEFTGSGSEYFKIWIVNVLLTILTIGIYSAWAKVRRLRYFYNNTRLAGSSFDFHGSPIAILKGRLIAVALIALINVPYVGIVMLLLYFGALPWLLYRSIRFHLANTSYRNVRFAFLGDAAGAYKALLLPLAVVLAAAVVSGLIGVFVSKTAGLALGGITLLAFYGIGPYLQYRMRRYYSEGARAGASAFGFHIGVGQYYAVYAVALGFLIALMVVGGLVFAMTVGVNVMAIATGGGGLATGQMVALAIMAAGFYLALLAVGPLLVAMLQNTVWSGTSLADRRFHSALAVPNFMVTWVGLTILTVITLGLYRPFAVVALARLRVEAMSWDGQADDMIAVMREGNQRAVGSEVADLMDVDIAL